MQTPNVKWAFTRRGLYLLRFAYTVATVLLATLVRRIKLRPLKGQAPEVRSELVSTPKEETWITVSSRRS